MSAVAWFSFKSSDYISDAEPYLQTNLPVILSWDYEKLKPLLTEGAAEAFETERGRKAYKFFSKLGSIDSLGDIQFRKAMSGAMVNQGSYEMVTFTLPGSFENGDADITVTLAKIDNSYRVHYLKINSDFFLE